MASGATVLHLLPRRKCPEGCESIHLRGNAVILSGWEAENNRSALRSLIGAYLPVADGQGLETR